MKILRVTDAELVRDFVVWVRFNDGFEGEVDLSGKLDGPVFEPLNDPEAFAQVRLDPIPGTLSWPNGADFAPEFLRDLIRQDPGIERDAKAVLEEALSLPESERAGLAGALLESLEPVQDVDWEDAWRKEIAARVAGLDSGERETISWEEICSRLSARLSERRRRRPR